MFNKNGLFFARFDDDYSDTSIQIGYVYPEKLKVQSTRRLCKKHIPEAVAGHKMSIQSICDNVALLLAIFVIYHIHT